MAKQDSLNPRKLGLFFKKMRKKAGFTQKEIAKIIKASQSRVSKIESGKAIPNVLEWIAFIEATKILKKKSKT